MSIYDKSTNQLLIEYISSHISPGQSVDRSDIVKWFKSNYPRIKSNTVNCHIIKFTTNHRTRIHYNASPANDKLFQLPDKTLRLYNPENDPKPIYSEEDELLKTEEKEAESAKEASEFAYESHLRDFLANNLQIIELGLRLYTDEEDSSIKGVEFDAGGKRIDILALDANGNYVVIELKVSKGYERTVGQLLLYRAWVKKNLAEGKIVRGIIIAKHVTEELRLAASETDGIILFEYDLKIDLRKCN